MNDTRHATTTAPPRVSESPAVIDSQRSASAHRQTRAVDVDEDEADASRSTIAYCRACDKPFGEFFNGWRKVTGSYYLPSLVGSYGIQGLHPKGKPKPASVESALVGCTIQPLVCNNCDDTLGIVCKSAPESKRAYADRDFFKLPKIQLRSDLTGSSVDAIMEESHQIREYSEDPNLSVAAMEAQGDGRAVAASKPSSHSTTPVAQPASKDLEDLRRHDHAPTRQHGTHAPPQKAVVQDRDAAHAPLPNRHHERVVPLASPVNGHLQSNGLSSSGNYPSNINVKLDAIDRIQTQVNLNRATLESCTRDISKLEGMVSRLQQTFQESFDIMRAEIITSRQQVAQVAASTPQGDRLDDQAMEVFTATLTNVASKANEVDSLKVQMELIKRKLRRLEEGTASSPAQGAGQQYSTHTREHSMHHTSANQAMTPTITRQTPPTRSDGRSHANLAHDHGHSYHSHGASLSQYRPEAGHQPHPLDTESAASGWVSVNPSAKRGLPNGIDGRSDIDRTPTGSPKRPKLAPLEPRHAYEAASRLEQIRYEQRMETEEPSSYGPSQSQTQPHAQSQTQPQTQPQSQSQYRRESHESYPDSTNQSTFIPYTADQPPDDSWRPESQRIVSNPAHPSPRGRGRGRGGRPRKSLPVEVHSRSTPEWEKEGWSNSQTAGPDGFYQPGRGGLVRRGSGGAQGRPPMPGSPGSTVGDPYGHTKKTRTKPIRNSDGVLIRKDGRPDMRSQSSAANLRKVHARKEEEKRMEGGSPHHPTSALATAVTSVDGHSPESHDGSQDTDSASTHEKRNRIMRQMFPNGVDEQRHRLYSTEQYFPNHDQSPEELKPSMSRSDNGTSERGSRASSDDDREERMVDGPAIERINVERRAVKERALDRPVAEARMVDRPAAVEEIPETQPEPIKEVANTTQSTNSVRSAPTSTALSSVTLQAAPPSTATLTATVKAGS